MRILQFNSWIEKSDKNKTKLEKHKKTVSNYRKRVLQSRLRCELNAFMRLDPLSKYDVTIGNYVANWKLGQDKTRLSSVNRISRLDKTVSKFSVADSLDLSPIQFTQKANCESIAT